MDISLLRLRQLQYIKNIQIGHQNFIHKANFLQKSNLKLYQFHQIFCKFNLNLSVSIIIRLFFLEFSIIYILFLLEFLIRFFLISFIKLLIFQLLTHFLYIIILILINTYT